MREHSETIAPIPAAYDALATLYNALMTGLVLSLIARRGEALARDFVQAHFRRQHLEKFLPGLHKLGLDGHPHAVACALYHYHSNALGGVRTEYHYESDRKAWVRYPPPRWIWRGTAACAIPHSVNIAMLQGWHANNGVSLGNPRLGFVCTGTLTSGAAGLEGYYFEYEHELAPEERLRFVHEEHMPRVDPSTQPKLETLDWPSARLQKTYRSYAMEYVRSLVPTLMQLLGGEAATIEIEHAARLIGLQFYDEIRRAIAGASNDAQGSSARAFAYLLTHLLAAQGERVQIASEGERSATVRMTGWRLFDGTTLDVRERTDAFRAWNGLWQGALAAHDRFMRLHAEQDGDAYVWKITDMV